MKRAVFGIVIACTMNLASCELDEGMLGYNYYWMPDYEAKDVGYPYGSILYKSNSQNIQTGLLIYADVVDVAHNDKFILAIQRPNKEMVEKLRTDGEIERKKSYAYLFENELNYYVIDKGNDIVYGPYNLNQYKLKGMELNIPIDLILNNDVR